jgi:hypothetical protein
MTSNAILKEAGTPISVHTLLVIGKLVKIDK